MKLDLGTMGAMAEARQNVTSMAAKAESLQQAVGQKGDKGPKGSIPEISQEFESLFVEMMLGAMRKAVPEGGFINGGNAEDIYRGMLDSEYAKIIAKQDKAGLSAMIEKQLLQIMGKRELGDTARINSQAGAKAYGLDRK